MPISVEIQKKIEFNRQWDKDLKEAHNSRGSITRPRVFPLPRKGVLVIRGLPGEVEIDTDPDVFR